MTDASALLADTIVCNARRNLPHALTAALVLLMCALIVFIVGFVVFMLREQANESRRDRVL